MSIAESSENFVQHQISEQKKTSSAILEILNNFVNSDKFKLKLNQVKDNRKKENSNNFLVKIIFNPLYLSLFIVFIGTSYLLLALLMLQRGSEVVDVNRFLRLTVFILGGLTGLLIWRIYRDFIKTIKNTRKEAIDRAASYDIDSYYEVINILGNQFKQKALNQEEIRFNLIINERKYRKNILIKLTPALAIIIVLAGVYTFGMPNYEQITNKFFNTFLSISGIIAIVKIALDVYNELLSKDVIVYERCVLILQKAQNIAKKKEEKRNYSINKNVKGKNLFRELRKIKIADAPVNPSTDSDYYKNDDE